MRIATWNVNSLKVRLPRVEEWLEDVAPDIVCLQETKLADGAFPSLAFGALGYESVHHGEGRWNGVAIASKEPITDVISNLGDGPVRDSSAGASKAGSTSRQNGSSDGATVAPPVQSPLAIAVDSNGDLLVASSDAPQVLRITPPAWVCGFDAETWSARRSWVSVNQSLANTARRALTVGPSMRATSSTHSRPAAWFFGLL